MLSGLGDECDAYAMKFRSVLDADAKVFRLLDLVRPFRNLPEIPWDRSQPSGVSGQESAVIGRGAWCAGQTSSLTTSGTSRPAPARASQGLLRRDRGDLLEAEQSWLRLIDTPQGQYFASEEVGLRGFRTRQFVPEIYRERFVEAEGNGGRCSRSG